MSSRKSGKASKRTSVKPSNDTLILAYMMWDELEVTQIHYMSGIVTKNGKLRVLERDELTTLLKVDNAGQIQMANEICHSSKSKTDILTDFETTLEKEFQKSMKRPMWKLTEDIIKNMAFITWNDPLLKSMAEKFGAPVMSKRYAKYSEYIPKKSQTKAAEQSTLCSIAACWLDPNKDAPLLLTHEGMRKSDGTFRDLTEDEKQCVATFKDGPRAELDRFFKSAKDLSDPIISQITLKWYQDKMRELYCTTVGCPVWDETDEDRQNMSTFAWEPHTGFSNASTSFGKPPVMSKEYVKYIPKRFGGEAVEPSTTGKFFSVMGCWPIPKDQVKPEGARFVLFTSEAILQSDGTIQVLTNHQWKRFVESSKQPRQEAEGILGKGDLSNSPFIQATIQDYERTVQERFHSKDEEDRTLTDDDCKKISEWVWDTKEENSKFGLFSNYYNIRPLMSATYNKYNKYIPAT